MRLTTLALATLVVAAAACGSSTGPKGLPFMTVTSDTTISDTTNAHVGDLVIQVRDSSGYSSYKNLTVHVVADVINGTGGSSPAIVFTDLDNNTFSIGQVYTDASGRAILHARLGTVPGSGLVHLSLGGTNSQLLLHVTVNAPPVTSAMLRAK